MNDLAELLAVAPHHAPFTSDDPCVFFPRDPARNIDPNILLMLASLFLVGNPNGSWREFTRWLATRTS